MADPLVSQVRIDRPWPSSLTPGDRLQRLHRLCPEAAYACQIIIDDQLARAWPKMPSIALAPSPLKFGKPRG